MPAPRPRPSSLAAALFGALCPRATDSEAFTEAGRLLASSMPRRSAPACEVRRVFQRWIRTGRCWPACMLNSCCKAQAT